jgi:RNA polymerase subunit RPABC4/transcription elongation factor Spt4
MSNIKQCQNCQTEAQPGSGFCTNCGERLQEILNCNSCGAQLQQGWKACPDCGNKVQTKQGLSEDQAPIATAVKEKVEKTEEKFGSDGAELGLDAPKVTETKITEIQITTWNETIKKFINIINSVFPEATSNKQLIEVIDKIDEYGALRFGDR